jgi:hypothetical protein
VIPCCCRYDNGCRHSCIDYVKVSTKETKLKYNELSENVLSLCTTMSTGVADDDQTVLNNGELDVEGNRSTASPDPTVPTIPTLKILEVHCSGIEDLLVIRQID